MTIDAPPAPAACDAPTKVAAVAIDAPPTPVSSPAVRHSVAGVLAEMSVLAAATRDAGHWAADERRGLLGDLDRAIDGPTAVRAAVLVAERESGTWQGGGDRSFESWRSRVARTTAGSARTQVREAEQLHAVPAVLDAVTAGRITMSHATALARVAGSGTPAQRGAVLDQVAQEGLLELAERHRRRPGSAAVQRPPPRGPSPRPRGRPARQHRASRTGDICGSSSPRSATSA